jgi:subfamily B ATP-binding cassette protein MsbA
VSVPLPPAASTWQTYKRLLTYTRRYWPVIILTVLGMSVDAACMGLVAALMKTIVDKLFVARDPYYIFWMPIWILTIFMVRGVASYVGDYGMAYVGRNVVQMLRTQVFDAYLRMTSGFFGKEGSGNLVARITYTSEQVAQAATDALKVVVVDGLSIIFYIVVMLYYSPYLTLSLVLMVPTVAVVAAVVSRRYRRISRNIQGMMGSVTGTVEETVNGHREVKIYGGQRYESGRFLAVTDRTRKLNLKVSSTNGMSSSLVQMLAAMALASIIFLATRPATLQSMTPGTFFAVLTAMGAILPSLKRLTNVQSNVQRGMAAAEDLFEILDTPPEEDAGKLVIERSRGDIVFSAVTHTYPEASEPSLRGIDLHCAPGTVTALVGRSGSGKSTLASLLPRFYEVDSGCIELDGHPLNEYTLASLRRQIAWVGQSVVLFDDTIARNIAYGELEGASEADIVAAAEAANAMEFINRLPEGLNSRVGELGGQLSGGQRQRIAIARAILKNAPILVLDEATSALDTESERLIQQALQRLMKDRTTLVIAHRLSTVEGADQIAVMDQGRIVERGTHAELLALGGHYAALHRMQFHDHADQQAGD